MGRPFDSTRTIPSITPSAGGGTSCTCSPLKGQRVPAVMVLTGNPAETGPTFPPLGDFGPNRRRASLTIGSSRSDAVALALGFSGWGSAAAGLSCSGTFTSVFPGRASSLGGRRNASAKARGSGGRGGGGLGACGLGAGCVLGAGGGLGLTGAALGGRYTICTAWGRSCAGLLLSSRWLVVKKITRRMIAACSSRLTATHGELGFRALSCSHSSNGVCFRTGVGRARPNPNGRRRPNIPAYLPGAVNLSDMQQLL